MTQPPSDPDGASAPDGLGSPDEGSGPRPGTSRRRRVVAGLVLLAVALTVALPTGWLIFTHSERHLSIGAHEAVVRPVTDGYATLDFGPLLPQVRLPVDGPGRIGVAISLGDSDVADLEELIARDAVIASQPEGEIAAVQAAVTDMALAASLRGAGVGVLAAVLVALAWTAVGRERRSTLARRARHPSSRQIVLAGSTAVVVVGATFLVAGPWGGEEPADKSWSPVRNVFPEIPADPVLDRLEISQGSAARGSRALVQGALDTYQASVEFYGQLAEDAAEVELRQPEEGQTTALVVTDRHANIGMDPVARAIADVAGARLLVNLGDDTSTGAAWEDFSINSLAREFEGFDVVAVAGNHDTGATVIEAMRDAGFEVLDGEPVEVGGVRFLGESDPRSSGLTSGYLGAEELNQRAIADQDARLTETACEAGDVAVLAVHSSASAREARTSGCLDLVLSGHLHRQVGPTTEESEDGRLTTSLTVGSTGGAVYAFALGSKLRRTAQVSVLTFEDGRPVGLQMVTFQPGGGIDVDDYTELELSPRDDEDEASDAEDADEGGTDGDAEDAP